MSQKVYAIVNNTIFASFILASLYALINVYITRQGVPQGGCPVESYRPFLYLALALGAVSFAFSSLKGPLTVKRNGINKNN